MPGPVPKDPKTRQRRNKVSTAAKLEAPVVAAPAETPEKWPLPPRAVPWHDMTIAWWKTVWRSPMAAELLESDVAELYVLAELVDQFWMAPAANLAKEIRLQRQCFGLTPIDRRRLQWEMGTKERKPRAEPVVAAPKVEAGGVDPRKILSMVK